MRLCVSCCFFLLIGLLHGQEYFGNMQLIDMEKGLSHYKVMSMCPDADGVWIGTADGLNYYDGFHWQYWKKEDGQLNFKAIKFIFRDQADRKWLFNAQILGLTKKVWGIDILEGRTAQSISITDYFAQSLPFALEAVTQFFQDPQGNIYFFADQRLWSYSPDLHFQEINLPSGFTPLKRLEDDIFLGILNQRIHLISLDKQIYYDTKYQLIGDKHIDIIGTAQTLVISQPGNRCLKVQQNNNGQYIHSPFNLQGNKEKEIALLGYDQEKQQTWLYAEPNIHLTNAQGQSILSVPYSIYPRIAYFDEQKNLWVGGHGLQIIKPERQYFQRYLHSADKGTPVDSLFRCRGITKKEGSLYVNTYQGPKKVKLKTGEITPLKMGDRIRKFVVLKDRADQLWFANRNLHRWDEHKGRVVESFRTYGDNSDRIWSMLEVPDGRIWIGNDGISYFENGEIKPFLKYNDYPKLEQAYILDLYQDRNGVIWVASNNGLYILDPIRGIVKGLGQQHEHFLPAREFQHVYQDTEGIYWLATGDAGLIRWNKTSGEWTIFDKTRGFLTNNIYAVYEDDFDYLWISSFNGLIRMHRTSYETTIFNEADGISDNEFNRISHYQADDGTLYFGGQNGVTAFDPKNFLHRPSLEEKLQLKVKHISIFGKQSYRDTLSDGRPIDLANLSPGSRVIDLEITSSDLFWAGEMTLHYALERLGHRRDKSIEVSRQKISADNHIELFGMTSGQYNVIVKAIGKNSKQLGETLILPLTIHQPFTQSPVFRIGSLAFLILSIWGLLKYRTARLRRRKIELEQMVEERTSQIIKDQKTIKSQAEQIAEMREQLDRKDELWLEQLENIINDRLEDTSLDLPAIIASMEIGRSQFFEKVKFLTNMTPNQYIQELRLTKAKRILEVGEVKTVKEVAYAVGISRPGYFSKLFKERFGILPSEYFRRHHN